MKTEAFYSIIRKNNNFMVCSHVAPDGDSIGSLLAMTLALKKMGKNAIPVVNDKIPKKYKFLPGIDLIQQEPYSNCDVIIALDSGDVERLGFQENIEEFEAIIINIDHHKSNTNFGNLNIIESNASSVGEILYKLFLDKIDIDYDIALNLYTSIITDTGCISYPNTTSQTIKILADLVDKGINPDYVSREIFEKRSLSSLILLKMALETIKISSDGSLATMYITKDMMETSGAKEEDTDGIINYAKEIEGVEVAVLFREIEENLIKVGLRSKTWFNVNEIAEKFSGGGHLRAAGCKIKDSLKNAKKLILTTIKNHMEGSNEWRN